MPKNTESRITNQVSAESLVLYLLSLVCVAEGHTFSWYTSKKGRTWLAFKCLSPRKYTTSAEYSGAQSDKSTLDTFAIVLVSHLRKLLEIEPPVDTWHGGAHSELDIELAWGSVARLTDEMVKFAKTRGWGIPEPIQTWLAQHSEVLDIQEPDAQD